MSRPVILKIVKSKRIRPYWEDEEEEYEPSAVDPTDMGRYVENNRDNGWREP